MEQLSIDDLLPNQRRKKVVEVLKLFELFAGYGSQSLALKRYNIPYESVGYCEIDKYAIQAYKALHGEHIKNYGDITKVNVDELPNMNLLTYSFPCQDISVAGKQRGLSKDSGTRSSLLWECHRIIEAKRPEYLMMENVKNLVGKQNMPDFQAWLDTLTLLGYNNYLKIVNAKHCGVPQNRERVFCVSIRQDVDDGLFRFEEDFDNGIRLKHILETEVDEKYYISEEKTKSLISQMKGDEICVTLKNQATEFVKSVDESLCLLARDYKGFGNQEMTAVVVPCITPDRLEKRQNGRRFKGDGDPMFTITSQDRHGVLIDDTQGFDGVRMYENESPCLRSQRSGLKVIEATKQGYAIASDGDSINLEHPNSNTRRGRVGVGVAQTLTTSCNQAVVDKEVNFGTKILFELQESNGTQEVQWEIRRFNGVQEKKILRPEVYGGTLYKATIKKQFETMSQSEVESNEQNNIKYNRMRDLWEKWEVRRTPQEREHIRFFKRELDCIMQKLSYEKTQEEVGVFNLRITNEGVGVLRKALSEIQKIWESVGVPWKTSFRIRKLTVKEVFRLMGLTDQEIDLIQSTGISNSQQYKLAGNSIVVDAMKFLKNLNGGD